MVSIEDVFIVPPDISTSFFLQCSLIVKLCQSGQYLSSFHPWYNFLINFLRLQCIRVPQSEKMYLVTYVLQRLRSACMSMQSEWYFHWVLCGYLRSEYFFRYTVNTDPWCICKKVHFLRLQIRTQLLKINDVVS